MLCIMLQNFMSNNNNVGARQVLVEDINDNKIVMQNKLNLSMFKKGDPHGLKYKLNNYCK